MASICAPGTAFGRKPKTVVQQTLFPQTRDINSGAIAIRNNHQTQERPLPPLKAEESRAISISSNIKAPLCQLLQTLQAIQPLLLFHHQPNFQDQLLQPRRPGGYLQNTRRTSLIDLLKHVLLRSTPFCVRRLEVGTLPSTLQPGVPNW